MSLVTFVRATKKNLPIHISLRTQSNNYLCLHCQGSESCGNLHLSGSLVWYFEKINEDGS